MLFMLGPLAGLAEDTTYIYTPTTTHHIPSCIIFGS